jgi:hypothetical protein
VKNIVRICAAAALLGGAALALGTTGAEARPHVIKQQNPYLNKNSIHPRPHHRSHLYDRDYRDYGYQPFFGDGFSICFGGPVQFCISPSFGDYRHHRHHRW